MTWYLKKESTEPDGNNHQSNERPGIKNQKKNFAEHERDDDPGDSFGMKNFKVRKVLLVHEKKRRVMKTLNDPDENDKAKRN
jgi:hypothetical protein